ncbi:recombinase family protein [Pontibacter sp. KCTC 32443]|uniref:recombinase family protein n=1 Tax=Pontibacter TaxID=323449 RepID=UPI00164CFAC8|nr:MULTISPECIES: recombinase family protein [Pontibacter]MBC5775730.1 recombinase family protein [Pontibacter sp. KCTC 32443]
MKKFVALYRVSTEKQNQSGLGLDAQKFAVESYVLLLGGEIIETFTEVVSGGAGKDRISTSNNLTTAKLLRKRPILQAAIDFCLKHNATLVVKEASRLTRYSLLMDFLLASKLDFVCADSPNDSPLIIKLKTALHEEELLKISERTKAALAAKKAAGHRLGSPARPQPHALEKAVKARRNEASASKENRQAANLILMYRKDGKTFREIVDLLNRAEYKTTRDQPFTVSSVHMLYKRAMQDKAQEMNFKFKNHPDDEHHLQIKAINMKVRVDNGFLYFEENTSHGEPMPYTSALFQQVVQDGAILEQVKDSFVLYKDRNKNEVLADAQNFIGLLFYLADRQYRYNLQKDHEASLDPTLNYISKGNPEKKQPPFILSKVL